MIRDEAIAFAESELKAAYERAEKIGYKRKTRYIEVLEMAIKTLKQEPCEDAISREAIKKDLKNCKVTEIRDEDDDLVGYYNADTVDSIVRNLPSVKPQTGHWIDIIINEDRSGVRCSKCGFEYSGIGSNFCPDCGAKMEVEQNG